MWIFDADGVKLRGMPLAAQKNDSFEESAVAGIHWFHAEGGRGAGSSSSTVDRIDIPPTLCIAFENGLIQFSRGEDDPNTIVVNTDMAISHISWDIKGSILAVTGSLKVPRDKNKSLTSNNKGEEKSRDADTSAAAATATPVVPGNIIKFFDAFGRFQRSVRIPGDRIASMSWEGTGLRAALAVDSFIFFANIRPNYQWAYLQNTVVFAYMCVM